MYAAIAAIFYFIVLRPQQQQRKQHDALVRALKRGDEVVTVGGVSARSSHPRADDGHAVARGPRDAALGDARLVSSAGRITRVAGARAPPRRRPEGASVALLDIHVLGSPILRQETQRVAEMTDALRRLADDMFETMYAAKGDRPRGAAVDGASGCSWRRRRAPRACSSIRRSSRRGTTKGEEGCLSIPESTATSSARRAW
jgi:hypothetical protein